MISSKARRARFNSRCKRAIEIGSAFNSREGAMFRKPFTNLFQASWLSFEAFTSLMRIGFLYDNCLGFGLVLWLQDDFILNTVLDIVA